MTSLNEYLIESAKPLVVCTSEVCIARQPACPLFQIARSTKPFFSCLSVCIGRGNNDGAEYDCFHLSPHSRCALVPTSDPIGLHARDVSAIPPTAGEGVRAKGVVNAEGGGGMKQNTWLSGEAHLLPNPCPVELLPYVLRTVHTLPWPVVMDIRRVRFAR